MFNVKGFTKSSAKHQENFLGDLFKIIYILGIIVQKKMYSNFVYINCYKPQTFSLKNEVIGLKNKFRENSSSEHKIKSLIISYSHCFSFHYCYNFSKRSNNCTYSIKLYYIDIGTYFRQEIFFFFLSRGPRQRPRRLDLNQRRSCTSFVAC